jgi:hypothetical protein
MLCHFLLNFPIYLATINWLGLGRASWATILLLWVPLWVTLFAAALWFVQRAVRSSELQEITAESRAP